MPAADHSCLATDTVHLFPVDAALEANWLLTGTQKSYVNDMTAMGERRNVVEKGYQCASDMSDSTEMAFYKIDCESYGCSADASLPFRRVATMDMSIWTYDIHVALTLKETSTLLNMPSLADNEDAYIDAVFQFALILLVAAVVYVRAERGNSSAVYLLRQCYAHCDNTNASNERVQLKEDAVVALFAILARLASLYRYARYILDEGYIRLLLTETAACAISTCLFICRYFVVKPPKEIQRSSILGGSTASIDSMSALLVTFCDFPLWVNSDERFEPIARLLIAVLMSSVAVPRAMFGACCCVVALCHGRYLNKHYVYILQTSAILWLLQTAFLASLLCDTFVCPFAFSLVRMSVVDVTMVRLCIFLSIACVTMTRINQTIKDLLKTAQLGNINRQFG
jgi:hypothetical protein